MRLSTVDAELGALYDRIDQNWYPYTTTSNGSVPFERMDLHDVPYLLRDGCLYSISSENGIRGKSHRVLLIILWITFRGGKETYFKPTELYSDKA
jgi:hypothetical protein